MALLLCTRLDVHQASPVNSKDPPARDWPIVRELGVRSQPFVVVPAAPVTGPEPGVSVFTFAWAIICTSLGLAITTRST